MSRRQLDLETLKSTINYELHRDPDKITKLGCQKSVHFITKNFVHVRNDIKNAVNKLNLIFYSNGYFPVEIIRPDESNHLDHYEQERLSSTKYNVNIHWPTTASYGPITSMTHVNNRTNICTIKGYFYYSTTSDPIISKECIHGPENNESTCRRYASICLTIQLGIFYDIDFVLNEPDIREYIKSTLFIDRRPKLYDDMVCNINRMLIQSKHNKTPSYLRCVIAELHRLFEVSDKL